MKIANASRQTIIASEAETAGTFLKRMNGLLGRKDLAAGGALIIPHCQSIHMFFMKFPIDVLFCNATHQVVGFCKNIQPFCLSPIFFKASYAIELPAGTIAATQTQKGDHLELSER